MSLYSSYTFNSFIFTVLATISTSMTLYLIFYILLAPLSFFGRFTLYSAAFIFISANIILVVDFFIYRIWKFHINAMVLNILMSPDAADSVQAGLAPTLTAIFIIVVLIGFEIYLIKSITSKVPQKNKKLNSKINIRLLPFLFLILLSDKIIYGFANMYAKVEYLEPTKIIPLYQPMDFTGTIEKSLVLRELQVQNRT